MNTERLAKIQGAIQEVENHGAGEITIKIGEDDTWTLSCYKEHKKPSARLIDDISHSIVDNWGFGGLTVQDSEISIIREKRMERI